MPRLNCVYTNNINTNISEMLNNLFGFYYCKVRVNEGYLGLLIILSTSIIKLSNSLIFFHGFIKDYL